MVRIVHGTKSPQMVRNIYGTKSLWYEKSGIRLSVVLRVWPYCLEYALPDYLRNPTLSIGVFKRYLKNVFIRSVLTRRYSALETFCLCAI